MSNKIGYPVNEPMQRGRQVLEISPALRDELSFLLKRIRRCLLWGHNIQVHLIELPRCRSERVRFARAVPPSVPKGTEQNTSHSAKGSAGLRSSSDPMVFFIIIYIFKQRFGEVEEIIHLFYGRWGYARSGDSQLSGGGIEDNTPPPGPYHELCCQWHLGDKAPNIWTGKKDFPYMLCLASTHPGENRIA